MSVSFLLILWFGLSFALVVAWMVAILLYDRYLRWRTVRREREIEGLRHAAIEEFRARHPAAHG